MNSKGFRQNDDLNEKNVQACQKLRCYFKASLSKNEVLVKIMCYEIKTKFLGN